MAMLLPRDSIRDVSVEYSTAGNRRLDGKSNHVCPWFLRRVGYRT